MSTNDSTENSSADHAKMTPLNSRSSRRHHRLNVVIDNDSINDSVSVEKYQRSRDTQKVARKLEPVAIFDSIVRKYGEPTCIHSDFALWNHHKWMKIQMRKHGIAHDYPKPSHMDHVFTTVIFKIPSARLWKTLQISDSLSYDRVACELTCRCAGWKVNNAILLIAVRYAKGIIRSANVLDVLNKVVGKAAKNTKAADRYSRSLEDELKV